MARGARRDGAASRPDAERCPAQDGRVALGRAGEEAAVRFLTGLGYEILARNVRLCGAELDIVARDGEEIAFVEVRSRSSRRHGGPLATIGPRKIARIARAAAAFLALWRCAGAPARFDVVGVDWEPDGPRLSLVRGAFESPW